MTKKSRSLEKIIETIVETIQATHHVTVMSDEPIRHYCPLNTKTIIAVFPIPRRFVIKGTVVLNENGSWSYSPLRTSTLLHRLFQRFEPDYRTYLKWRENGYLKPVFDLNHFFLPFYLPKAFTKQEMDDKNHKGWVNLKRAHYWHFRKNSWQVYFGEKIIWRFDDQLIHRINKCYARALIIGNENDGLIHESLWSYRHSNQ